MTQPDDDRSAALDLEAAQAREYGTYVAKGDIFYNGALAYTAGAPVPVSNVEAHGYEADGLVERVGAADEPAAPTSPAAPSTTPEV